MRQVAFSCFTTKITDCCWQLPTTTAVSCEINVTDRVTNGAIAPGDHVASPMGSREITTVGCKRFSSLKRCSSAAFGKSAVKIFFDAGEVLRAAMVAPMAARSAASSAQTTEVNRTARLRTTLTPSAYHRCSKAATGCLRLRRVRGNVPSTCGQCAGCS